MEMEKTIQECVWTTYSQTSEAKHSHRLICYKDNLVMSINGETETDVVSSDFTFLNLTTKKEASTVSYPPRRRHLTCVLVGSLMYMFGGDCYIAGTYTKDFWCYDCNEKKWSVLPSPRDPIKARRYQSMAHCNGYIYIFGGEYEWDKQLDDFMRFSLTKSEWEILTPQSDKPSPRRYSSLDSYGNKVYLFAGRDENARMNDLWEYTPLKNQWTEIKYKGSYVPLPRSAHTSVIWRDSLIIHGGNDGTERYCDKIMEFNFNTRQWTVLKTVGEIDGRYWHGSCITSNGLFIVNGGVSKDAEFCDGWHLIQLPKTLKSKDLNNMLLSHSDYFQDVLFVHDK